MFGIFVNWGPVSDFPDVGNVLDDDTVGGEAGTYEAAGEADVSLGVTYGEDGTEFTGSGSELGTESIFFLRRGR